MWLETKFHSSSIHLFNLSKQAFVLSDTCKEVCELKMDLFTYMYKYSVNTYSGTKT